MYAEENKGTTTAKSSKKNIWSKPFANTRKFVYRDDDCEI